MCCISDAVCLYIVLHLAVCFYVNYQESFDLGLPFFELITLDISIVCMIDLKYRQQTVSL